MVPKSALLPSLNRLAWPSSGACARQKLEHKPRKTTEYGLSEIEDIIWEVDEDANGWIDWENFVQLYIRCRKDRTVGRLAPHARTRLFRTCACLRAQSSAKLLDTATPRSSSGIWHLFSLLPTSQSETSVLVETGSRAANQHGCST